jgi:hypothetical protein
MQQHISSGQAGNADKAIDRDFRLFVDPGHAWLEVPRAEVVAFGAEISSYSYYDPTTDMAYLEEDCDAPAFLKAVGLDWHSVSVQKVNSSTPRELPAYGPEAIAQLRLREGER